MGKGDDSGDDAGAGKLGAAKSTAEHFPMPATRPPDSMTPLEAVIPSQIPSQLVMLSETASASGQRLTTVCPSCQAEVLAGRFCEQCGRPLAPAKSFCDQCGARLRPEAKFCSQCAAPTR